MNWLLPSNPIRPLQNQFTFRCQRMFPYIPGRMGGVDRPAYVVWLSHEHLGEWPLRGRADDICESRW